MFQWLINLGAGFIALPIWLIIWNTFAHTFILIFGFLNNVPVVLNNFAKILGRVFLFILIYLFILFIVVMIMGLIFFLLMAIFTPLALIFFLFSLLMI